MKSTNPTTEKLVKVIESAGGEIVGHIRLQKIVYLLSYINRIKDFSFEYSPYSSYSPYSEDLCRAITIAKLEGAIEEEECPTDWGGTYSIYRLGKKNKKQAKNQDKEITTKKLLEMTCNVDILALELTTALIFLIAQGIKNPWKETIIRNPVKVGDPIVKEAQNLFKELKKENERLTA